METFERELLPFMIDHKETVCGIVVFLLLWYIIHRFRINHQPFRAASTENGSVFVSRATVLNLVQSACSGIEEGSVKRVRCINKRRLLLLKLYISLDVNQSFEVASMRFQEAAKHAVTHCLGALKAVRVDVVLDGMKGDYIEPVKSVSVSTGSFASSADSKSVVFPESPSVVPSKVESDPKRGD